MFEGGFLGLDNISVFDRSQPLPSGYSFKQADATGWMAMFALNLTIMALEIATEDPDYEDIAIQTYAQFLAIANTIGGYTGSHVPLWDAEAGFFKDLVVGPDGRHHRIDVYSWVGLIPLFACEIVDQRLLAKAPRFQAMLKAHEGGLFDGHYICACPASINEHGERLLSLVDCTMLPPLLTRLLSEEEFLSPYGVRSVSRLHAAHRDLGTLPGVGQALIEDAHPRRVHFGAVWRQCQLARANLDADELHAGAGAAEVSSLPGRRVHGGGALLGQPRADSQGDRHLDRGAPRGRLPPRQGYWPIPAFSAASPFQAPPALAGSLAIL